MKYLVTGASGYIGGKVIEGLARKEGVEEIVGIDVKAPAFHFPNCRFEPRDIRAPLDLLFDKEKFDAVIHTAFILPPIHSKQQMEDININGTKNVLSASANAGVQQILYTSSTIAYGFHKDNDVPLTEESPLRGNADFTYAKNKKEIEALFEDFQKANPEIVTTIVRPCFVVGPGFNNPLANHLKKKRVFLPRKSCSLQFVHEEDLTDIMLLLLERKTRGQFNVCGEGTISFREMVQHLGNTFVPLPRFFIYLLNNLFWHLRFSSITDIPSPALKMTTHSWLASSEKLIKETGYRYKYDSKSAFLSFAESLTRTEANSKNRQAACSWQDD